MRKNTSQGYPSNPKTDFEFSCWVPTKFGEKKLGKHWRVTLC